MEVAIKKEFRSLDSQARKLAKDATHVGFWGNYTLDPNRVFVSGVAASKSAAILKAGLVHRLKPASD